MDTFLSVLLMLSIIGGLMSFVYFLVGAVWRGIEVARDLADRDVRRQWRQHAAQRSN